MGSKGTKETKPKTTEAGTVTESKDENVSVKKSKKAPKKIDSWKL